MAHHPGHGNRLESIRQAVTPRTGSILAARLAGAETTGGALQRLVEAAVARVLEHEPGVLEGDPYAIHQMRAGVRRLRALLKTFRPVLEESWLAFQQGELRWLAGHLGAVRDRDVLLERLETVMRHDDRLLAIAREHLRRQREAAMAELLRALGAPRASALRRWFQRPEVLCQAEALADSRTHLPELVARQWRRLKQRMRKLPQRGAIDARHHEARKQAKVLRYAAEAVAQALPKRVARRAERMARRIADLQTALGALQDHRMAREWLERELDDPVLHMLLACEFHEVAAQEERECRRSLRDLRWAWRRARQRKVRGWLTAAR